MTTKVILRDKVWKYSYSVSWADTSIIVLDNFRFPTKTIDLLASYNIHEFLRERETTPDLQGLKVIDSVEFEDPKDALAFILKYGNYS
jgi:hypothetical protein